MRRKYWPGVKLFAADERGAAMVEFTILLPVLVFFAFGMVTIGSFFYVQNGMLDAARQTARLMALQHMSPAQAQTAAQGYLGSRPLLQHVTYNVTASCVTTGSPIRADAVVEIRAAGNQAVFFDILGAFASRTLSATVTMRKEGAQSCS